MALIPFRPRCDFNLEGCLADRYAFGMDVSDCMPVGSRGSDIKVICKFDLAKVLKAAAKAGFASRPNECTSDANLFTLCKPTKAL